MANAVPSHYYQIKTESNKTINSILKNNIIMKKEMEKRDLYFSFVPFFHK